MGSKLTFVRRENSFERGLIFREFCVPVLGWLVRTGHAGGVRNPGGLGGFARTGDDMIFGPRGASFGVLRVLGFLETAL